VALSSRRRAASILAALLAAALAAAALLAVRNARHDARLAEGRRLLVEGDLDGAAAELERLRDSGRVGPQARAGLEVVGAARGADAAPAADPAAVVQRAGVPLRPLADGAMRAGRHRAAIALGRLMAAAGDTAGLAYQAAALVELGRDGEARAVVASAPSAFGREGLGGDVVAVLDLLGRGAATIVRDRAGRLLGATDGAGAYLPAEGIAAEWIPRAALVRPPAAGPGEGAPSRGLRLALDLGLTRAAAEALAGRRGAVVLIDPASGEVRAAVSDAASFAAGGTPALDQQREPASIQKLITATAAMRAGLDPDAEIARMTCAGSARYGDGSLWCASPGGQLRGLGHALAISCNVAFANLGARIGRAGLLDELRRYGFDSGRGGAGRIRQPAGDARQLADLSVGLTATETTPLHAARMAAVFATGTLPGVVLHSAEDGRMGLSPAPIPRAREGDGGGRPVIDAGWVAAMQKAMALVTGPGGTAEGVAPPGFPVAMKTGTASEPGQGYHVNYIGVGPMPRPALAFCVRVTHGSSSPAVTRSAREALGALLGRLAGARGGA
jgi:peptidoglycan glycosyltransferase